MLTIPNISPAYYNYDKGTDVAILVAFIVVLLAITFYDEWRKRQNFKMRESRRAMKRINRETARMIRATDSMLRR